MDILGFYFYGSAQQTISNKLPVVLCTPWVVGESFQCEIEQPIGNKFFQELAKICLNPKLCFITGKIEMVKSKWGLAFSAVICVIASLVMASGLCSFFGLVTTLDSR